MSLTDAPVIRWFLPPSLRGASTERARRYALFLVYTLVLLLCGSPFTYILGVQLGLMLSGFAVLAAIFMVVLGMFLLRWSERLDIASHWVSFALFSALCIISYQTDGISSPGLWWLAICPIYTFLFSGLRAGLLWVNLVVITAIGFYTTGLHAEPLATRLSSPDHRWLHLSSFLGFTGVLIGYIASYRYVITRNQIQRLHRRRKNERDARKRAERANRAKTQFLSNTSHHIRTPINTITGKIDLLKNTQLTQAQREHLEIADDSARQLLDTIDNMLDIALMESDSIELSSEPFRIRSAVNDVLRGLSPSSTTNKIELIQQVDPSVPTFLVGDEKRFRQVLIHLVENAITHAEANEIIVRVREQERTRDSCLLEVQVIDDGIGIEPDVQNDIFESFLRSDHSRDEQTGGAGIGLAICKELVMRFGGELEVHSTLGEGSSFHFTADFGAPEHGFTSPTYRTDELKGMTVLVKESNGSRANSISNRLSAWEMNPVVTSDLDPFLNELQNRPSLQEGDGLLLLDAGMNQNSVDDVLDQVQEITEERPPTLIMTRYGDEEEDSSVNERAEGHILKPIHAPTLRKQIKEALTARTAPLSTSDPTSESSDETAPRSSHILLVEDNDMVRGVVQMQLEQLNHTVTAVSNGRAAVNEVRDNSDLDLVLMDIQMPIMDGIEATEAIRDLESDRATIPIVALTANALESTRKRCMTAGMTDYLTKPAEPSDLQKTIGNLHSTD